MPETALEVTFHEWTEEGSRVCGTVRWDGRRLSYSYPRPLGDRNDWLGDIMKRPIPLYLEERMVYPNVNPEEWLRSLHDNYRGTYLFASQAKPVLLEGATAPREPRYGGWVVKVAVYGPYNEVLYGTLNLTPTGIVPHPAGPEHRRKSHMESLQLVARNWRMPGHDDVQFLRHLPVLLRGHAVLMDAHEVPWPGFDAVAPYTLDDGEEDEEDEEDDEVGEGDRAWSYAQDDPASAPRAAALPGGLGDVPGQHAPEPPVGTPLKPPGPGTVTGKPPPRPSGPLPRAELLPAEAKPAGAKPAEAPADPDFPDYSRRPQIDDELAPHWDAKQNVLSSTPVASWKINNTGRTVSLEVTLANGAKGLYKPRKGEIPLRRGIHDGTFYRREVAASLAARLLGFADLVPVAAFRRHGEEMRLGIREDVGSIADWVGGNANAVKYGFGRRFDGDEDAARAAWWDYIIGNTDRHADQWGLKTNKTGNVLQDLFAEPGKMTLYDHGLTLAENPVTADFGSIDFWRNAADKNLAMPDTRKARGKVNRFAELLHWAGVGPRGIQEAVQRLEVSASGRHNKIMSLPHPVVSGRSLLDLVNRVEGIRR